MNLHLLKLFVIAVREQGFTRAADVLQLTQPAVSKGVRELEEQLGTTLLERQGKRFRPTEAGQVLYDYGRALMAIEREASEVLRGFRNLQHGTLVIGASTTVADYWLPAIIGQFLNQHPTIELKLRSANTDTVRNWLVDCSVDVALVEGAIHDPAVESRPWRTEDMVLIAPAQSAQTSKRLNLEDSLWMVREPGSGSREAAEQALRELGIERPNLVELNSNEAILHTVAAGCGVGVVPKIMARDALALKRVRRLHPTGVQLKRTLYRLRLPNRPQSNAALAFEALLGEPSRPQKMS
ncbi:MAG TPA: LysR family transcriptional regulator [Limnobacter sp.]|uniref:LysR family transcriptional regulator n=1 Tax=Limnobacter sp. TaxID=2003368 RepID=UPI002ED7D335